jgi:hypothetical protein
MADLSPDDVKSLGLAVGIDMQEPLLTEVTHNINALRELIEDVDVPELVRVEPLPVIPPHLRIWKRG